ncbi:MAG: DHH family phosphoesterase [Coriobacteriales bacterium]|nr:DHH family phosphoesterase [Coriobacteriales bacterium]
MLAAYHHAAVELRKARTVAVCGHVRPDGDAIGSVLALTLALRDAGIRAVPTLADADADPPSVYKFLPGFALYTHAAELETPDVFVSLDTPNLDRLGAAAELAQAAKTLLVLDHHPDAKPFGVVNVLDPTSAATGSMVWRLLKPLDIEPTPEVAFNCYVALITDTGRFQFSNTTPSALRDAAEMLEAGADPAEAAREAYQSRTRESLALEATAVSRIEVVNDGQVALSVVRDEDFERLGALPEDAQYLVDAVRNIGGVEAVVLSRIWGDEVRVNLRAKGGFDVGSIARHFGGGGHKAAAGFTWAGTYDDMLSALLPKLPGGEGE